MKVILMFLFYLTVRLQYYTITKKKNILIKKEIAIKKNVKKK
jgi:hypothetical protein